MTDQETRCPICFDDYDETCDDDKPAKHREGASKYITTECKHFFCWECCFEMHINGIHECPFCKRDVSDWLAICDNFHDGNDSTWHDKDEDEVIEIEDEDETVMRRCLYIRGRIGWKFRFDVLPDFSLFDRVIIYNNTYSLELASRVIKSLTYCKYGWQALIKGHHDSSGADIEISIPGWPPITYIMGMNITGCPEYYTDCIINGVYFRHYNVPYHHNHNMCFPIRIPNRDWRAIYAEARKPENIKDTISYTSGISGRLRTVVITGKKLW